MASFTNWAEKRPVVTNGRFRRSNELESKIWIIKVLDCAQKLTLSCSDRPETHSAELDNSIWVSLFTRNSKNHGNFGRHKKTFCRKQQNFPVKRVQIENRKQQNLQTRFQVAAKPVELQFKRVSRAPYRGLYETFIAKRIKSRELNWLIPEKHDLDSEKSLKSKIWIINVLDRVSKFAIHSMNQSEKASPELDNSICASLWSSKPDCALFWGW